MASESVAGRRVLEARTMWMRGYARPESTAATVVHMFVLGIDPGLSRCGYGAVESGRAGPKAIAIGVLRTDPADELPQRLAELQAGLPGLLADLKAAVVAVELVFFQVNVRTAMSVGQASGLAMAEAVAAGCQV